MSWTRLQLAAQLLARSNSQFSVSGAYVLPALVKALQCDDRRLTTQRFFGVQPSRGLSSEANWRHMLESFNNIRVDVLDNGEPCGGAEAASLWDIGLPACLQQTIFLLVPRFSCMRMYPSTGFGQSPESLPHATDCSRGISCHAG
jgi:hypothetical protein